MTWSSTSAKRQSNSSRTKMIQDENKRKRKLIGEELRDAKSSLSTKNQELANACHQIHKMENWWKQATEAKKETREKFEA